MTNPEAALSPPAHTDKPHLVMLENVSRQFGSFKAVDNISLHVEEGEIFGLLGPNGAGKSTTIKMICTLLRPSSGRISVGGADVMKDPARVRHNIGIVFQDTSLDSGLTAQENLEFHCMMYHVPSAVRAERIRAVLEMMDLMDFRDRIVRYYSGGMRRRLEIARGLLHRPRLLILDEPTVGLDPQTRSYIWSYVRDLRQRYQTSIFMTTHYMEEAENCDRIAIIDKGVIVALDTPQKLKQMVGEDRIEITTIDDTRLVEWLKQRYQLQATLQNHGVVFEAPDSDSFIPQLITEISRLPEPILIEKLNVRRPTLEDVFLKLTGRTIREEEGAKDQKRLTLRQRGRL